MTSFFLIGGVQVPKYDSLSRKVILYSFLHSSIDGLNILQMFLYHECMNIEPKIMMLIGIKNMYAIDV